MSGGRADSRCQVGRREQPGAGTEEESAERSSKDALGKSGEKKMLRRLGK